MVYGAEPYQTVRTQSLRKEVDGQIIRRPGPKLTAPPELGLEPAGARNNPPALGAVLLPVCLREGHGWEHVSHVVALEAQLNLGAGLMGDKESDRVRLRHNKHHAS